MKRRQRKKNSKHTENTGTDIANNVYAIADYYECNTHDAVNMIYGSLNSKVSVFDIFDGI